MNQPLVSVCIPTYNGASYLREALDSCITQTYRNIEVIISDDASTDHTLEISHDFRKNAPFPVFIHSHVPDGIGANWDHAITKSNGEFIKFLFQDDLLDPRCIEMMMNTLSETKLSMVVCKRNIIDSEGKPLQTDWLHRFGDLQHSYGLPKKPLYIFSKDDLKYIESRQPVHFNFIGEPVTALFTKNLYTETGRFASPLKQYLDLEYWLKVIRHHKIGIMEEKLISFRVHDMQSSNTNQSERILDEKQYIEDLMTRNFFLSFPLRLQKKIAVKKIKTLTNKLRIK